MRIKNGVMSFSISKELLKEEIYDEENNIKKCFSGRIFIYIKNNNNCYNV